MDSSSSYFFHMAIEVMVNEKVRHFVLILLIGPILLRVSRLILFDYDSPSSSGGLVRLVGHGRL